MTRPESQVVRADRGVKGMFKKGERVRLSAAGVVAGFGGRHGQFDARRGITTGAWFTQSGRDVRLVRVRWDGVKTPMTYAVEFIASETGE